MTIITLQLKSSTAAGSLAGYLFQPERALYWLACSNNGSLIGIETEDDIVRQVIKGDEPNIREQDKHAISEKIPFGDHSKDLWNTLGIWLQDISNGKADCNKTQFHLVTNKDVDSGIVLELDKAKNQHEIEECITKLKDIALRTPDGIKVYVDKVTSYKDELIGSLIKQIVLCDGRKGSFGEELLLEIKSKLLVPEHIPFIEIYNSLLGWIHSTAMNCWRNGIAAWLSRDSFVNYHHKLITRHETYSFIERPKSLITINSIDREAQANAMFVKQLYLLAIEEKDDLLIDAIDDYLMCASERIRLSVDGDITKYDIDKFDQILIERWKLIHSNYKRRYKRAQKQQDDIIILGEDYGFEILTETLNHRERLAGQRTEQFYLTKGSYHRLANILEIGWHPDYATLLEVGEDD